MFTTKRKMGFATWTASVVVTLGIAAGASAVVPQLIASDEAPPAATTDVAAAATVETPAPAAVAVAAEVAVPEVVPEVVEPEVVESEVEVVVPPVTKAPAPVVQAPVPTLPPITLPPVTLPALAARVVPTAAQVQGAITGITGLVQLPLFFSINANHVADVGNRVCTAFDQGQTFAQVKAIGLAQVAAYVPVSPAAADYAVRTAVSLYCPAYASKLV